MSSRSENAAKARATKAARRAAFVGCVAKRPCGFVGCRSAASAVVVPEKGAGGGAFIDEGEHVVLAE